MKFLAIVSPLNNEGIAAIALCVDNIVKLELGARYVTLRGWETLSTAINNRPTPVS